MYYDVVVSIYKDEYCNERIDSHLLCGGFETEDEAKEEANKYINNKDFNEYKYCYSNEEYACIEVEEHNEVGSLECIIKIV